MTTIEKEQFWTQIVENPSLWGTIQTSDKSFNAQAENIWTVMNETFIKNGSLKEVNRWEIMLGDRLENSGEGTLDERKSRILKQITEHSPITIGLLEQLIKETTDNNYEMIFDKQNSSLMIKCFEKDYNSIVSFIPRVIPTVLNVEYVFYDKLPSEYLAAEFLECYDTATIKTGVITSKNTGAYAIALAVGFYNREIVTTNNLKFNVPYKLGGTQGAKVVYGWNGAKEKNVNATGNQITYGYLNWLGSGKVEAKGRYENLTSFTYEMQEELEGALLTAQEIIISNRWRGKIYRVGISDGGNVTHEFRSAIDPTGTPCMFNIVSRKPFYNSGTGSFIVGMTLEQARKLGELPDSGGAMKISLPTGYDTDAEVMNALDVARSKGWTLTIQTYEDASTTSTYSMRRIWVRKTEDENGNYVDSDGNRFIIEWCVDILSPENKSPENYGYESFRNKESAIEYWGLTEWIDPEIEKITEQQN